MANLEAHDQAVVQLCWNASGTRLASSGLRSTKIWDVTLGKELLDLGSPAYGGLMWSDSGQRLHSVRETWDATAGHENAAALPPDTFTRQFRPQIGGGFF